MTEVEQNFILPNTLGAMAKTFYVKVAKSLQNDDWYIKPGSKVTGVKVIAQGEKIRDVRRLIRDYPLSNGDNTEVTDWYKVSGTAVITNGVDERLEEIHWYQCENIGKVEYKLKDWGDKRNDDKIHG